MAPDLPLTFRELVPSETGAALGAQLDDGYVVVSRRLANHIQKGAKAAAKARRRQANQSRRRNRSK